MTLYYIMCVLCDLVMAVHKKSVRFFFEIFLQTFQSCENSFVQVIRVLEVVSYLSEWKNGSGVD